MKLSRELLRKLIIEELSVEPRTATPPTWEGQGEEPAWFSRLIKAVSIIYDNDIALNNEINRVNQKIDRLEKDVEIMMDELEYDLKTKDVEMKDRPRRSLLNLSEHKRKIKMSSIKLTREDLRALIKESIEALIVEVDALPALPDEVKKSVVKRIEHIAKGLSGRLELVIDVPDSVTKVSDVDVSLGEKTAPDFVENEDLIVSGAQQILARAAAQGSLEAGKYVQVILM